MMFQEAGIALETVTLPLFAVFAISGAAIRFGRQWLSPLGIALAALLPCMLAYMPAFPPSRLLDYLPILGFIAFLLFLPFDLKDIPFSIVLKWLFSAAASWLLLRPRIPAWSFQEAAQNLIAVTLVWTAFWSYLEAVSGTRKSGILMLAIAAFGCGIVLYFDSSVVLGKMGIALGVALGSWLFLSAISPGLKFGHSGFAAAYTVFASLILIGGYYGQIPRGIIFLVLGALAAELPVRVLLQLNPEIRPRSAAAMTATLALIPVAIAAWISVGDYVMGS